MEIVRTIHKTAGISGRDFSREFARNLDLNPARHIDTRGGDRAGMELARGVNRGFNGAIDLKSPTVRVRESVRRDTRSMGRDLHDLTRTASATGGALAEMGTTAAKSASDVASGFSDMTKAAGVAGVALAGVVGAAVVNAVADLGKAVVTASQSLWLLPAGAAAAAAGIGTLMIGFNGLGDAMKNLRDPEKFAESLQSLSPAAQQAALAIRALIPQWDQLTRSTQDSLFNGLGQEINKLANQYLPGLQSMTTSIAGSFNTMFKGVADTLMSNPQLISQIMGNIETAFSNAAQAAAPFTEALMRITAVGSDFLPELASSISDAASQFADFIADAAETGKLKQWIEDGINAAKELASTVFDVGHKIYDAFGSSKTSEFKDTLNNVVTVVDFLAGAINGVSQSWTDFGNGARTAANYAIDAMNGVLTPLRAVVGVLNQLPGVNIDVSGLSAPFAHVGGGGNTAGGGGIAGLVPGTSRARGAGTHAGNGISPVGTAYPSGGYAVPAPPPEKGKGGGKGGPDVTVPYPSTDPMSLLQGYPATSSLYAAAQQVIKSQYDVAQQQAELDAIRKDSTATQAQIQKEENDVIKAKRDAQEAEMRLNDQKLSSTKQFTKEMDAAGEDISAGLDKDFGISRGIGGIVENLIKAVGTALTYPLQKMLGDTIKANPNEGSGLVGVLAARGAFGDQYTPQAIAAANATQPGGYGLTSAYQSTGGYPGDAALLANVPAGRYSQTGNADLVQGLGDCSSSVEDLVNIMDGRPTSGRSMATGNAAQWLSSRGFLPGMGGLGDFRVGWNSGHMQATLPGGTPFNWGSDASAARGGVGGTGADDPAFSSHYYRPAASSGVSIPGVAPIPAVSPADIYSTANMNPALTPGIPSAGQSGPGQLPGSPLAGNFPGSQPYAPTAQAQAAPGWKPSGGSASGGGLIGMAGSAAGMGLDMIAPGSGAAAQMVSQLLQRTVQYGAQMGGHAVQGVMDTLSVSDPDGGQGAGIGDSWLGRLAGSLASAAPALPATAGKQDQSQADPNTTQHGQGNGQPPGPQQPGGLSIGTINMLGERQNVTHMSNDLALATARAGMR